MATLAMPLTRVLAISATRSSVNSLGQAVDPVLHLLADVVVAHPAADERQTTEVVDRLGELVGELAGLGDGPRPEDEHQESSEAEHQDGDDGHGVPATHREAPLQLVDQRVEGEGDEEADRDAGEHRRGVAEERQQRQRADHGERQPDERPPVEAQAQPGPGGLVGIDAER